MEPFLELVDALNGAGVRFVLIGVAGANYYAPSGQMKFHTDDRDLFLPPDPGNLVAAWSAAERLGFDLTMSREPLDYPRDLWLAEHVVRNRALTRLERPDTLQVDLTLVMAGFEFDEVWSERNSFVDDGVAVPTARLVHIAESKARAGRPKDGHFLQTHEAELREWMTPAEWLGVMREERRERDEAARKDEGPSHQSPPENK
jgi:hypothetical protein